MHGRNWNYILSDLFVNLAAGWFGAVYIESSLSNTDFLALLNKFILGIISLGYAKIYKDGDLI